LILGAGALLLIIVATYRQVEQKKGGTMKIKMKSVTYPQPMDNYQVFQQGLEVSQPQLRAQEG
jgi:hypothetical protein